MIDTMIIIMTTTIPAQHGHHIKEDTFQHIIQLYLITQLEDFMMIIIFHITLDMENT